jgi:hypothetical protein
MPEQFLEILYKVNSPELQSMLWWVKFPLIAVTIFFLTIIAIALVKTPYLELSNFATAVEFLTYRPYGVPKVRKKWKRITARLQQRTEVEYKLAIIEADALMDEITKKMRIPGKTMDERVLNITPLMISNVEELRAARQIRNNVVFDPDYRVSFREAQTVLESYEHTLEELDLFR